MPPTELALIVSTAPFFNYVVALVTGRENAVPRRLLAVAAGFVSSAILILSREGMLSGQISWWTLAAFAPHALHGLQLVCRPLLAKGPGRLFHWRVRKHLVRPRCRALHALFRRPGGRHAGLLAYWTVLVAGIMWIVERIAFFTLIRDKGAVYTIQAVYVSTPAAVLFAVIFYGGGADIWLWVSLAILMLALWLNNSGSSVRPVAATQPSA